MRTSTEEKHSLEFFALSKAWLVDVGRASVNLNDLLKTLLGLWLCEQTSQSTEVSSSLLDTMTYVEERLRFEEKEGTFDPFRYDAKLLFLCHLILSANHYNIYGIEGFAQQVSAALRELPSIPLRHLGEAVLLSHLGYCEYPPVPTLKASEAGSSAFQLLRADKDQLRTVCSNITAATHFGRKPLQASASLRSDLACVLPIILLQSLREYNLEISTILLRTIHYLHLSKTRAIDLAIRFLISQQQSDGRFGYLAIETVQVSNLPDQESFDAISELYLPITVSCLWSLAEALVFGFRLASIQHREQ